MPTGKVVRFDESRAYGFIAPDDGGEDVFVHASELVDRGVRVTTGTRVQFETVGGERGPKAYSVRTLDDQRLPSAGAGGAAADVGQQDRAGAEDDELFDVLSEREFVREITELLLTAAPRLTGEDIRGLRGDLLQFSRKHGWVD